ncbi:hypothetical protein M2168_001815 [Streptomyces sp. CZ24]|nr:hypothetical protein [Streptomyces sp. CZ24]
MGEVDDGGAVGAGLVVEGQGVVGAEAVGDGHLQRPGEAHVAVGAEQGEADGGGVGAGDRGGPPDAPVEAVGAAVQGVAPVVGGDGVVGAVEREAAVGEAVGVPPDQRTEVGAARGGVRLGGGQAQHDGGAGAVGGGDGEVLEDAAVGEDGGGGAGAGVEVPALDGGAVGGVAVRFVADGGGRGGVHR